METKVQNASASDFDFFKIRVASANSLFNEMGHDAQGIFRLYYNAISSDYFFRHPVVAFQDGGNNHFLFTAPPCEVDTVLNQIKLALDSFEDDIDVNWADKRIKQYHEDHQKIQNLTSKIDEYGFWSFICFWKADLNQLRKERREFLEMTISVNELTQIAYYKFLYSKLGHKDDFIKGLREFMDELRQNMS